MIDPISCETGVCGSIMISAKCLPIVMEHVSSEDFQTDLGRAIFDAAVALKQAGEAIDPITIREKLGAAGYLSSAEARNAIMDIMATPTAAHAEQYAKGLKKASTLKKAREMLLQAATENFDPDELIDAAMKGLYELGQGRGSHAVTISDALMSLLSWYDSKEPDRAITAGYLGLDSILHGMRPGDLVLLAARPSVGKSAFGANIAMDAARDGVKSVIFSCEMSKIQLVQRFIARESWIDLDLIQDKNFAKNDKYPIAERAARKLSALPLYLYDRPGISIADIRRTLQSLGGVGFVAVDYLQLLKPAGKSETRNLEIARMSAELKQMAREFQIPIMLLSQLNRNKNEHDEPGLSDFRDSGAVEQDADKAIFLWQLQDNADGSLKVGVKVAKNRMGRCGTVVMRFDGKNMRYTEIDEKYQPPKKRSRFNGDDDFPPEWRQIG